MTNERLFNAGEMVRWVRSVSSPEHKNAIGTVITVTPGDRHFSEFTLYDIKFSFGMLTLYGAQIEIVDTKASSD